MKNVIRQIRIYFGPLLFWALLSFGMLLIFYKNKIFLSAWLAALFAQILKMIITSTKLKRFYPIAFFRVAGMPSAHTATVTSLTTFIFLQEGVSSAFILLLVTTFILIYDLLSSHGIITLHQEALTKLLMRFEKKNVVLKDEWGHTADEIAFGIILGIITAMAVYIL